MYLPISYKLLVFNWPRFGSQTSQITPQLHREASQSFCCTYGASLGFNPTGIHYSFKDDDDDGDDGRPAIN